MKKTITTLAVITSLLFTGCYNNNKPVLYVYTWADFFSPEKMMEFEKKYDCNVSITTFSSNEEMYAKLKAGGTGYDIINPTTYQIPSLINENLIEKLDTTKLPNVMKNFDNRFSAYVGQPCNTYSVSYMISYGGLLVNTNKVDYNNCNSWSILSNSRYNGRISLLNDIREVLGAALMYLGYSMNTKSQKEIDEAVNLIKKQWKPNVRKFDSESYKTEVPAESIYIGHGYSSDSLQVILGDEETEKREDLVFVFPKEGFTICSDEFVIMKDSKNKELAYKFIDFFYDPMVCKDNMEYVGSITPNVTAISLLDEDFRNNILPDEKTLSRAQLTENFDDKPEIMDMYNKAWDEILKTSER